ncbi:hypothetical protein [Pedobacter sp. P26]|uniref:hypothetical protein n=1 Tax=Pedobacter sp. P26 TaxID=3423956 RepID=UPI003D67FF35
MKTKQLIFAGLAILIMSVAFGFTTNKPKTILKVSIIKKQYVRPDQVFLSLQWLGVIMVITIVQRLWLFL